MFYNSDYILSVRHSTSVFAAACMHTHTPYFVVVICLISNVIYYNLYLLPIICYISAGCLSAITAVFNSAPALPFSIMPIPNINTITTTIITSGSNDYDNNYSVLSNAALITLFVSKWFSDS